LDRDRELVPEGQFCEVRYEDLIARPIDEVHKIYDRLELGDFDKVQPALEAYFAEKADYKADRYNLSPEIRAEIDRRWRFYLERYGYAAEPAQAKCA
jgi:omega-hydroxy-beta-dihydromenaquinone-9 sulfotransferase